METSVWTFLVGAIPVGEHSPTDHERFNVTPPSSPYLFRLSWKTLWHSARFRKLCERSHRSIGRNYRRTDTFVHIIRPESKIRQGIVPPKNIPLPYALPPFFPSVNQTKLPSPTSIDSVASSAARTLSPSSAIREIPKTAAEAVQFKSHFITPLPTPDFLNRVRSNTCSSETVISSK